VRSSTGGPDRPADSILDTAIQGLRTVDVSGTLHRTPAVGSKTSGIEASRKNEKGQAMCLALSIVLTAV
jgi:hypothetical protein